MSVLLKVIIVLVAIYFVIRTVARYFMRRLIGKMHDQVEAFEAMHQEQFRQYQEQQGHGEEGEEPSDKVKIKYDPKQIEQKNPNRSKNTKKNDREDEYIDFEEVGE